MASLKAIISKAFDEQQALEGTEGQGAWAERIAEEKLRKMVKALNVIAEQYRHGDTTIEDLTDANTVENGSRSISLVLCATKLNDGMKGASCAHVSHRAISSGCGRHYMNQSPAPHRSHPPRAAGIASIIRRVAGVMAIVRCSACGWRGARNGHVFCHEDISWE